MSRFIRNTIAIPDGVSVDIDGFNICVKGPAGEVKKLFKDKRVRIEKKDDNTLHITRNDESKESAAMSGTYWRILNSMLDGAKNGIERILDLMGVGYRAQLTGNKLVLQLGFSNPINHTLPDGVTATMPSQTEIRLKSADKMLVGQVAADIRRFRPPEPYKGKGIRYRDERVVIKEIKKK